MDYEIYLTTKCTRQCAFCYVQKTSFVESRENVEKFIQYIKCHENNTSQFNVNLFGGEPLIAFDLIQIVVDGLSTFKNAKINLITNCDLLSSIAQDSIRNMSIYATAYDIFTDPEKYSNYVKMFNIKQLQYTFTQDDIDKCGQFAQICNEMCVDYKIRFSHDKMSWSRFSSDKLQQIVYGIAYDEIDRIAKYGTSMRGNMALEPLTQLILAAFGKKTSHKSCLDSQRMSFFNGKFYGKCIRFLEKQPDNSIPIKCKSCEYFLACNHFCHAELENGQVNEKLCAIKFGVFSGISESVYNKKYNNNIYLLLHSILKNNSLY